MAPAPLPSLLLLWQQRLLVDHGVSLGLVVGHRRYKDRVLVRAGWSIGSCGRAAAVVAWVGSSCGLGGHRSGASASQVSPWLWLALGQGLLL